MCADDWPTRTSRFCGTCGEPLRPVSDESAPTRRSVLRTGLLVIAGLVVIAGIASATTAGAGPFGTPLQGLLVTEPDPQVALPELAAGARQLARVDPDEAARLRDQVDPDRLRCEPRGCEAWRREVASDVRVVAADSARLALQEGTEVVVLDAITGEQVLRHDLGDLEVFTPDGEIIGSEENQVALLPDGVVVANRRWLVRVDDDGSRRWVANEPGGQPWSIRVSQGGERVVVDRESDYGIPTRTLIDATDGRVLWQRDGEILIAVTDDTLITLQEAAWLPFGTGEAIPSEDGIRQLIAIDTDNGRPLWSRELDDAAWPNAFGDFDLLLVQEPRVTDEPGPDEAAASDPVTDATVSNPGPVPQRTSVLRLTTGEIVDRFDGELQHAALLPGGALLVTTFVTEPDPGMRGATRDSRDERAALTTSVRVLESSGSTRWSRSLPTMTGGCCPEVLSMGDGTVVIGLPIGMAVRLDLTSGDVVDQPFERRAQGQSWTLPDGSGTITWQPGTLTHHTSEGTARVLGGDPWLVLTDPLVLQSPTELLGVRPVPSG